jgi:UDP-galactopyranose mutase
MLPDIIAFSHLRWDFVYQRPQHILSRLARRQRVFVIEEPIVQAGEPHWECFQPTYNVTVCRFFTPIATPGFHDDHLPALMTALPKLLREHKINNVIAWMYTPMALPLLRLVKPQHVIYDCMDELSSFLHAPPALLANEQALLKRADLVFTGGPSLYRAKRHRHPAVHCFPSSVDTSHFQQARFCLEASDQVRIPRPRLGFYGVIDERFDIGMLSALAERHPEWQMVMVGPVVKIDPATLPQMPNIHYFGQRDYHDLPTYLAGWDVCLLPFARNEATRFISPTKTLEYMAAEKMIVSTPINDVIELYGESVGFGATPAAFVAACEYALHMPEFDRVQRLLGMRNVLQTTSWDSTVQAMQRLMATLSTVQTPIQTTRAVRVA